MFHATERLPHLLPPSAYWSAENYSWEMENVFSHSWHFVGLRNQLSRPGDFITTTICSHPIQVRNFDGKIGAVSNICAHRHCLLSSEPQGSSKHLSCQYHGWEYDACGATRRIPLAHHFAPLNRDSTTIPVYRVECIGPLVFVNLDSAAPNLESWLGLSRETILQGFGDGRELMMSRVFNQAVNWKIPVENSLEAYHVPTVHPDTFRDDPGEVRSEHVLGNTGTTFQTTLPFAPHSKVDAWFQRIEGRIVRALTNGVVTASYQHHHVFPNMLLSLTDMVSLLHIVRPTGPKTCQSVVIQFGRVGSSFLARNCCRIWGSLASMITLRILSEDFQLYPAIQCGLDSSKNQGMLGRCEERIYEFQRWLQSPKQRGASSASKQKNADPGPNLVSDHSATVLSGSK